jgi:steroid delta-isomerase-like uncharacterized protein
MSQRKNKRIVLRLIDEVWNRGNVAVIDQLCSARLRLMVPGERYIGSAAFAEMVRKYRRAFPDLRIVVHQVIAEGADVVVRWVSRGTQRGHLGGAQPTHNQVRLEGVTRYRFEQGMIVAQDNYWDQLTLLHQLGAVPPQPSVAA